MRYLIKWLLISFLSLMPLFIQAQENDNNKSQDKNQIAADKKKKELAEEIRKADEKGRKRHLKMQTKETRKRMKRSKKKSNQLNANKRDPFYKRWYKKYIKRQRNV
jgi:hypothetical protein